MVSKRCLFLVIHLGVGELGRRVDLSLQSADGGVVVHHGIMGDLVVRQKFNISIETNSQLTSFVTANLQEI